MAKQTVKDQVAQKQQAPDNRWLREENPEIFYILQALDGNDEALPWLQTKSAGLALFARALGGDKKALDALRAGSAADLDDLFVIIRTYDLAHWLADAHPDLHLLFEAVRGDETALRRLKRRRAPFARLAQVMRELYQDGRAERADDLPEATARVKGSPGELPESAAADVGCLVGEMHLRKGDYALAVAAFSRAIETNPAPDEYEGRARAYRALALADELKARELRARQGPVGDER